MTPSRRAVLAAMAGGALAGCGPPEHGQPQRFRHRFPLHIRGDRNRQRHPGFQPVGHRARSASRAVTRADIVARYGHAVPHTWGFDAPAVVHALPTTRRVIALTFDACGGPGGSGYARVLIDFLRRRDIPATLFINSRWIDANPAIFRRLAAEPLFEIAYDGTRHRLGYWPLRLRHPRHPQCRRGVRRDLRNQTKLTRLLGTPPRFFRSGTAYCDDVAARIVTALQNASSASRSTATAAPPSPPNRSVRRSPPPPADPSSSAT